MSFKNKSKMTSKGIPYNYDVKPCEECGKDFKPNTNVQKYCCLTCQNRTRRKRHKEQINKYNYEYAKKNKEKVLMWKKKSESKPEFIIKRNKRAREYAKRDYVKERNNERNRRKRKEIPSKRIENNLRARIYKKMQTYKKYGKNFPAKSERGIKINLIVKNLMINLPKDFNEKKYHIDHIEPICSFDLTDEQQLNKAFAIENHRWLLAEDNMKKIKEDRSKSLKLLMKR